MCIVFGVYVSVYGWAPLPSPTWCNQVMRVNRETILCGALEKRFIRAPGIYGGYIRLQYCASINSFRAMEFPKQKKNTFDGWKRYWSHHWTEHCEQREYRWYLSTFLVMCQVGFFILIHVVLCVERKVRNVRKSSPSSLSRTTEIFFPMLDCDLCACACARRR